MRKIRSYTMACVALALSGMTFGQAPSVSTPTMIGVNIAGGDFGKDNLPGILYYDYFYPSASHWDWAKGRGLELVRVPFRWERVQRVEDDVLDDELWAPDMAAIDASLDLAEARGMRVVLDMHNYAGRLMSSGSYKIGTPELPTSEFANAWRLLADHFKDRDCIWGYDIMNEPHGLPGGVNGWKPMAQAAIDAIREVDTRHAIIVEGYFYAQAQSWATNGAPLIDLVDPADNLIFSAHMYPDNGSDGRWNNGGTVQKELVDPGTYPSVGAALQVGVDRIKPFVDWCVANNVRGLVGEYGSTRTIDTANWALILENTLDYMVDNGNGLISGTQWGGGSWNSTYTIGMGARKNNSNAPFMPMLETFSSGPGSDFWYDFKVYDDSLVSTSDYSFTYVFPGDPAVITLNMGNTDAPHSGTKSIKLNYEIPTGGWAGAGMHVRGPLSAGGVGGIDLSMSLAASHVLSFYAKGTPGANPALTFGSTLNASGVDGGSDTATGNWISLGSVKPLTTDWQLYEIPLSAFLNANLTGDDPVQRIRINAYPADGNAYEVEIDRILLSVPSVNTAPSVTVDTSVGGSTFSLGQTVTLVSTASDADAGDAVEYVEFFANDQKVGLDDTAPYEWSTTFGEIGDYALTAIAVDRHGVSGRSVAKSIAVVGGPTTDTLFTSTPGQEGWTLESVSGSGIGGTIASGKARLGDDAQNKQYRAIFSFDTSSIPDGAVITEATLVMKRDVLSGTNPFTTHGNCEVAVISGSFNGNSALEPEDFEAPATACGVAIMSNAPANGDLSIGDLDATGLATINKTGITQFRVAFETGDDGNSAADFMQFNSGSDINPAKRPTLLVTYY